VKIVHFIDTRGVGGAETVMMATVQQIDELGYDVEIWHLGSEWLAQTCERAGIAHRTVWCPWAYKKAYLLPLFLFLLTIQLHWFRVGVVHSHIYTAVVSVGIAAAFWPGRHIGTLHDTYFLDMRRSWRRMLLLLVMKCRTKLVTISNQMRDYVASVLRVDAEDFAIVYNGTDPRRFYPPVYRDVTVKEPLELVYVGRLIGSKRIDLLLDAAATMIADGYKLRLRIVGGGMLANELQVSIDANGLASNVELLGERDDVPDLLRTAHVFVLPSDSEGLPCSIIEAMATGLPIIASDVGGNGELVESGGNGYLFSRGSLAELVDAIVKLYENVEQRARFGKQSLDLVEEKFTARIMAKNYVQLYEQ